MARVSTCPYCQREVGLLNERPTPYSYPREPRLLAHAATERPTTGDRRRPKCKQGSGLPVAPAEIREVADRPSTRSARTAARMAAARVTV